MTRSRTRRLLPSLLLGILLVLLSRLAPDFGLGQGVGLAGCLVLLFGLPLALVRFVSFLWSGPEFWPPPRVASGKRLRVRGLVAQLRRPLLAMLALGVGLGATVPESVPPLFGAAIVVAILLAPVLLYLAMRPGPVRDRATLARELAGILRLGLPAAEAVEQLAGEARRRFFTRFDGLPTVLHYLHCHLLAGAQLSYAMQLQEFFPPFWPALVTMGERSETLPEVLDLLAQLERERHSRPSLMRPLLTLPVVGAAMLFLNRYIMPTFITLAGESDSGISFWMVHAATVLAYLSLLIPLLFAFSRDELEGLFSRIPGLSAVSRWEQQCLVAFAFWAGARQQRPQPELLELARLAVSDSRYGAALKAARGQVGADLASLLASRPDLFCAEFRWLVHQGIELGDLDGALQAAVHYLRERRHAAEARWSLGLQLLLQALICLIVALAALGMWQPLLSLTHLFSEGTPL